MDPNINDQKETDAEIEDYRVRIERLVTTKNPATFSNAGVRHAAVVAGAIYRNSEHWVSIYAKNMNGEIGDQEEYYNAFEKHLCDGKNISVILDSDSSLRGTMYPKCFKLLKDNPKFQKQVEIRLADEKFRSNIQAYFAQPRIKEHLKNENDLCYFMLGDAYMFRVEFDNKEHKAKCSFNNHEITPELIELFKNDFPRLIPYSIN